MVKTKLRGRRSQKEKSIQGVEFVIDTDPEVHSEEVADIEKLEGKETETKPTFFGLVDANEIDYFKQAEATLNINAFEQLEERQEFVRAILEEARGKELKLVTNQICSKLMERVILLGDDIQVKFIFKQFQNHFLALSKHKYSSHVLETLLVRVASLIEKEIIHEEEPQRQGYSEDAYDSVRSVTVEHIFLEMMKEVIPELNSMIIHPYASHVTRLIILIISGKELPSTTISNSTLRSKKSKIARKMIEIKDNEIFNKAFQVPPSFKSEIEKFQKQLLKNKDTKEMRLLAIDKVASPVLQLILQVEGIVDKERSLFHLIFLADKHPTDPQEEAFVEHLLSDSVGSHFLESLVKGSGVRLNLINRLYQLYMKERILKLCNRSTSGVFIIQALLHKLKLNEVKFILDQIIPELSTLLSINNNQNLELSSHVINASIEQKNYKRQEIIDQLFLKFTPHYNKEDLDLNDSNDNLKGNPELFENVLGLAKSTLGNTRDDWPTSEERRRSLLLEKLMEYDYDFVICVWFNIFEMPQDRFIQMCLHGVFSHVIENALRISPEETKAISILRKRILNIFVGHISELAVNSYGSHIIDKLWDFTIGQNMYKDRIATELANNSKIVKDSAYGKMVWKNWSMELFNRKKYDWKSLIKQQELEFFGGNKKMTPIEMKIQQLKSVTDDGKGSPDKFNSKFSEGPENRMAKRQKVRGRNR